MTNSIKSLVVSFVIVSSLSAVACVGGPEDNNEPQAIAAAGTGGSSGSAGTGGSGGSNADPCDAVSCKSNETCEIVNKKAKCVDNGTGGSAGSGGSGGSSGSSGSAGTGGSGGSTNPCNTKQCGSSQHCEVDEHDAAVCLDDAVQQIDIVMANGCRAVLFDNLGTEVANSSNGNDVHKAVNAGWAGWAMLTQQCPGQAYKADWSPVGAAASSTSAFTSIKVNGEEVKAHALICADKYGDPGGSKGWKKIAIPMSGGQWDKCP